jgi:ABC-2 type transport system permease protein
MGSTWRWLTATWGANLRSALEYRVAFLVQAGFMAANNFLFLAFWAVFFARFENAGGWTLRDVALLYGVCATSFGLSVVLFGGALQLARRIEEGRLDTWLLRSRPVLLQAGTSRMQLSGYGDVASGLLLLVLSGNAQPGRVAAYAGLTAVAVVSFSAFCTLAGSLAFFVSRAESVASLAVNGLLSFSLYPPGLFGGWTKVALYVLLPAGLVGWAPAGLVRQWSWTGAAFFLLGSAALWGVAALAWRAGLARYESGNLTQAVEA